MRDVAKVDLQNRVDVEGGIILFPLFHDFVKAVCTRHRNVVEFANLHSVVLRAVAAESLLSWTL